MYRTYRNPFTLEETLEKKRNELQSLIDSGAEPEDLIDIQCDIAELEQEVNFAWQDDEYDSDDSDWWF